jgi:hypothetical protein
MDDSQQSDLTCENCEAPVTEQDTFCRNCGAIFSDQLYCVKHPTDQAEGVCVICCKPYCEKCGKGTNGVFLCGSHCAYEVQEGMARVFGSIDNVQAQYATTCLEQAGYHPFLYSRRRNPGAGMIEGWMRGGIRNYGNHPIVEIKVLVPFSEVLKAEETLKELGFTGQ